MKPNLAEAQRNELASLLVAATDELDRVIVQRGELLAALLECVTDDPGSACFNTGKKTRRLQAISDIASAAIAKATA